MQTELTQQHKDRIIALWDRGWMTLTIAAFLDLPPDQVRQHVEDHIRRIYEPALSRRDTR
jgi:hypothetical protein